MAMTCGRQLRASGCKNVGYDGAQKARVLLRIQEPPALWDAEGGALLQAYRRSAWQLGISFPAALSRQEIPGQPW